MNNAQEDMMEKYITLTFKSCAPEKNDFVDLIG